MLFPIARRKWRAPRSTWTIFIMAPLVFVLFFSAPIGAEEGTLDLLSQSTTTGEGQATVVVMSEMYASASAALSSLIRGLEDPLSKTHAYIIGALREIGSQGATHQVMRAATEDKDMMARGEAIEALKCIQDSGVVPLLRTIAQNPREHFLNRMAAVRSLGRQEDVAAVPFLKGLLRDANPAVAAASARELAHMGDGSGFPKALSLLTPTTYRSDVLNASEEISGKHGELGQTESAQALRAREQDSDGKCC